MRISELIENEKVFSISTPLGLRDANVSGITYDSKRVKTGYIFAVTAGNVLYIQDAIDRGAVAVITDDKSLSHLVNGVAFLFTKYIRPLVAKISRILTPFHIPFIAGVTGTNGKSSVCNFACQLWDLLGDSWGMIGTDGAVFKGNDQVDCVLTTPDSDAVCKLLQDAERLEIRNVVVEASSQGLHQSRLDMIKFDASVWTNIDSDHLDYHKSKHCYAFSKRRLFMDLTKKGGSMIVGDGVIDWLPADCSKVSIYKFADGTGRSGIEMVGIKNGKAIVVIEGVIRVVPFNLHGRFQLANVIAAAQIVSASGYDLHKVVGLFGKLTPVPGRMEYVCSYNDGDIYIDFAHTTQALNTVVKTAKLMYKNVGVVFGCGGDRDKSKRALMGRVARRANWAIVTDDNPRTENPESIRSDILSGLYKRDEVYKEESLCNDELSDEGYTGYETFCTRVSDSGHSNMSSEDSQILEIPNREDAIHASITRMRSKSCVIIAGMGVSNEDADRQIIMQIISYLERTRTI